MKMMMYSIMIMSTMMVISSSNILMTWLSLELNLFCFVPILLDKMSTNETEASFNYFLSQALGSMLLLFSSMTLLTMSWFSTTMTMLMMISILLKSGAAPCYYWYPSTMEHISWLNCFLLSTWQKIAPLFILMYIILPKYNNHLMYIISPMNALMGGLLGLSQTSMKKIMAYSSITHTGWMLSASITNMPYLFIMYFMVYTMITLPLFFMLNKMKTSSISDLWTKQKLSKLMIMTLSILLLSLGGLPPLSGFMPKLLMISMMINHSIMMIMALILGSVMNLFFYLNIILNMMTSAQKDYNFLTFTMISPKMMSLILAMNLFILLIILM